MTQKKVLKLSVELETIEKRYSNGYTRRVVQL